MGTVSVNSQSWEFGHELDPVRGKCTYARVQGQSDNPTNSTPQIVLIKWESDEIYYFYLSNSGHRCDNIEVWINFDEEKGLFRNYNPCRYSNKDGFMYFSAKFWAPPAISGVIEDYQLFEQMKNYSTMQIRLEDDCDIVTMTFPLSESSNAINKFMSEISVSGE